MDALAFIAKTFGATAKFGAALGLEAAGLAILRRLEVAPFTSIDQSTCLALYVAGLLGFALVMVEMTIALWAGVKWLISKHLIARDARRIEVQRREAALRNLSSMPREFADILVFLKTYEIRRFQAATFTYVLHLMKQSSLLEVDDPFNSAMSGITYYSVPDYVWAAIETVIPSDFPVPHSAPWIAPVSPQAWMGH